MAEQQVTTFGDIFPGFDTWYKANHDENGRYVGEKLPGLQGASVEGKLAKASLLRLAEEVRQQEVAGETEEGGFGGE